MRIFVIIAASLLFLASGFGSVHAQSGTVSATVRPNPLKVDITAPSSVVIGQWFDISANVTNLGQNTITQTVVAIYTPPEVSVKGNKKRIGNLAAGTETITWRAKANAAGNFVITAEASGKLLGEPISSSDSATISAAGSLGAFLFKLIFGV